MRTAVYNSAIPDIRLNTVHRTSRWVRKFRRAPICCVILSLAVAATATDWSAPEEQLARKIVAVTGPGAVAVTMENRSSLAKRDSDIVQNGLRASLEGLGLHFVKPEQAAATVTITLSEDPAGYVWVGEIRQGAGDAAVVMVSTPRPQGAMAARASVPLSLLKIPLWAQDDAILDVAFLEESAASTHIAVLDAESVSLYRMQSGKWQLERALDIAHGRPWPRDLRGRLIPARDHLLDVYLPGVTCASSTTIPLALNCRESDDPWPLVAGTWSAGGSTIVPQMKGFFAPTRNFFTGVLAPGLGKFTTVPKFYSAAVLPREKYPLWLFAATDGQAHMVDGVSDQVARLGWGSDLAGVKTTCGAGWQILATSSGDGGQDSIGQDSIRAYEFPDRDPVAVSAAVDFPGAITALWTESKGDTAVAVARNRETGEYEAFRLAISCGQ